MSFDNGYSRTMKLAGLTKSAAPSNYAQDFLAGLDPFGAWTNEYGLRAERADLSEGEHALKRGIGTAGGVVGGSLLVPSAIYGVENAMKGFAGARGGMGRRLGEALSAGVKGFKQPVKSVIEGRKARKGLSRVADGGEGLSNREQQALLYLGETKGITPQQVASGLDRVTPTARREVAQRAQAAAANPGKIVEEATGSQTARRAAERAAASGPGQQAAGRAGDVAGQETEQALGSLREVVEKADPEQIRRISATPKGRQLAQEVMPFLNRQYNSGLTQLGLGGAVGAGGAFYQYGAGRQTERDTTPWARLKNKFTE